MLRFARNDGRSKTRIAFVCVLNCLAAFEANAEITKLTEGAAKPSEAIPLDAQGELDAFELQNAAIPGLETLAPDRNGRIAYRLTGFLSRRAVPSSALLVELDATDALRDTALRREMDVLSLRPDPAQPVALRYAALRELVAHLRRTSAGRLTHVLARGSGEQGRILRLFAQPHGNRSETGKTFDGLLLHDARENEFSRASADGEKKDAPLVVATWSSGYFWRQGRPPIAESATSRNFFLAGSQAADATSSASSDCAVPINSLSIAPAARALLVALDEWARRGVAPPASRMPSAKDRGLVARRDLRWPSLPALPAPPEGEGQVPAIDADGNETAGLRLPDLALPLGTFTGWNLRKSDPKALCDAYGGYIPFAKSQSEREKSGDPRRSLPEKYGLRDYYVATMRVIADKLVKDRLLLKEDADAYVADAKKAGF